MLEDDIELADDKIDQIANDIIKLSFNEFDQRIKDEYNPYILDTIWQYYRAMGATVTLDQKNRLEVSHRRYLWVINQ